jgi:hypothetical protein
MMMMMTYGGILAEEFENPWPGEKNVE